VGLPPPATCFVNAHNASHRRKAFLPIASFGKTTPSSSATKWAVEATCPTPVRATQRVAIAMSNPLMVGPIDIAKDRDGAATLVELLHQFGAKD
jgi:hypothetical protein